MTDRAEQKEIGRELRNLYERTPSRGIPDRIWHLLLALEERELAQARAELIKLWTAPEVRPSAHRGVPAGRGDRSAESSAAAPVPVNHALTMMEPNSSRI